MRRRIPPLAFASVALLAGGGAAVLREADPTEPNQVAEIAPGVWFRHGDLLHQGHCNNGLVVFRDFVLVIDANFPSGAEACLADVRKISDKPVRLVFATHHHGDHAYGIPVWLKNGAIPISYRGVAGEMARLEPGRWRSTKRPDVEVLGLDAPVPPIITYPDRLVIDDGTQRVELLHFGTAHTRGDGFAYLPKQKVLFTGDAVINGPYNFMGDGDTASWIRVIDALMRLDVEVVAGGHGPAGGRDLLGRQRRFLVELRAQVAAGIAAGKTEEEIAGSITLSEEVKPFLGDQLKDQVAKIRREMVGLEMPLELVQAGFEEGPSPSKGDPGWIAPAKVVLTARREWREALQKAAPGVKVVAPEGRADLLREVADADGVIGALDAEALAAARKLRWIQGLGPGAEREPEAAANSTVVRTGARRSFGPAIADQVLASLLSPSRGTGRSAPMDFPGKTMLLLGAEGIDAEIARRAEAFGMAVIAVRPKVSTPPPGVMEVHPPADLPALLPRADVLVVAGPPESHGVPRIGKREIDALRSGGCLIDVSRGPVVDREAVAAALESGKLVGAGLDDAGDAGVSESSRRRVFLLARENLRRFAAGERLLD